MLPEENEDVLIGFNKMCIIESLTQDDKRTGELLYQNPLLQAEAGDKPIKVDYYYVQDKHELLKAFDNILNGIKTGRDYPFLHIEMHGTNKHIELESGENITWEEFAEQTRRINYATENNLLLVLASCYGIQMVNYVTHDNVAAFRAIIAPKESVSENEIEDGFKRFYLVLLRNKDIVDALDELNNNEKPGAFTLFEAKELFTKQWSDYAAQFNSPETSEPVLTRLLEIANKENLLKDNGISDELFIESAKLAVAERERDKDKILQHYLMQDKENDFDKFQICVEEFEKTIIAYHVKPEFLSLAAFEKILANSYAMRIDETAHSLITLEATPLELSKTPQAELQQHMKLYDYPQYLVDGTITVRGSSDFIPVLHSVLKTDDDIINIAIELMCEKYPEIREKMNKSKPLLANYKDLYLTGLLLSRLKNTDS
ncbi:MAG: hypothetical protein EOP45_15810 [Sphingobacteriaceae bacterium]|nr:MAG: hypothetical protein EOP45_15810 [Sphingobacteriaceae bacterium]